MFGLLRSHNHGRAASSEARTRWWAHVRMLKIVQLLEGDEHYHDEVIHPYFEDLLLDETTTHQFPLPRPTTSHRFNLTLVVAEY